EAKPLADDIVVVGAEAGDVLLFRQGGWLHEGRSRKGRSLPPPCSAGGAETLERRSPGKRAHACWLASKPGGWSDAAWQAGDHHVTRPSSPCARERVRPWQRGHASRR